MELHSSLAVISLSGWVSSNATYNYYPLTGAVTTELVSLIFTLILVAIAVDYFMYDAKFTALLFTPILDLFKRQLHALKKDSKAAKAPSVKGSVATKTEVVKKTEKAEADQASVGGRFSFRAGLRITDEEIGEKKTGDIEKGKKSEVEQKSIKSSKFDAKENSHP